MATVATGATASLLERPAELQVYLAKLMAIGVLSYVAVVLLIPILSKFLPAKLSGKDLCKKGTPAGDIPMYAARFSCSCAHM